MRSRPLVAIEVSSTASIIGAAIAGFGPAVVSGLAILREVDTRALVDVPTVLDLRRPLTAIWRRDERLSDSARDLLAVAIGAVKRQKL